jgi:excisionase family DNA binding protein
VSLLTVQDVAKDLNVSERTVYNLVHSGKIAYIKVLGIFRIEPEAVIRFKEENRCQSESISKADTKYRVPKGESVFIELVIH